MQRVFIIVLSYTFCLGISSARAAADPAELLIRQGVELRHKGRDAEALTKFQSAYDLARSPRSAAQLGLCEQSLGRWLEAERHLTEALAAESDPWIARNQKTLFSSRNEARAKLVRVDLSIEPAAALIKVDADLVGRAADLGPLWLLPGNHVFSVSLDGYSPKQISRTLTLGESDAITIALDTINERGEVQLPLAAVKNGDEKIISEANAPGDQGPAGGSGWQRYAAWGAFGGAALGLGYGLVSYFGREAAVEKFNQIDNGCGKGGGIVEGGDQCEGWDRTIKSRGLGMAIGLGGAGVLGALGIFSCFAVRTSPRRGSHCAVPPFRRR